MARSVALVLAPLALASLASLAEAGGNLTVSVTPGGDLLVVGDELGNNAWFDREDGFLALRNAGGTINGGASSYAVPAFTGGVTVRLGGGDDSFGIMQTFVADDVEAELGDGNDHCDVESDGERLRIDLGDGADFVNLESAAFERTAVAGGRGDDRILLFFYATDDLSVDAGTGNDEVSVRFCYLPGSVRLDGGAGADGLELEDPGLLRRPKVLGFETRMP